MQLQHPQHMEARLGGYRIVRKLVSASNSDVLLVVDPAQLDAADGPRQLILKRFDANSPTSRIDNEIDVLGAAASPHVVELVDVFSDHPGWCLVFPRLLGGSLAELIARRRSFECGEAVTILAPIAGALATVHDAGWVHGALGSRRVLFDELGSPILTGFGNAERATADRLKVDFNAFEALATEVLNKVSTLDASAVSRLVASFPDLTRFADELFVAADPIPVRFIGDEVSMSADIRQRFGLPSRLMAVQSGPRHLAAMSAPSPQRRDRRESRNRRENQGLGGRWRIRAQLMSQLSRVRRGVWLVAGGGVAAAVLATVLLGTSPASVEALPAGAGSAASPDLPDSSSPELVTAADRAVLTADDPIAAVETLLTARTRCLRFASPDCLASIEQSGSAIADADKTLVASGEVEKLDAAALAIDGPAALVQRTGGIALVSKGSASVLVLKSIDGWVLRDLFLAD